MTRHQISDDTKQKMKDAAKYAGYIAGSVVVLGSVVAVGLSVVNNLFKPEYLSKLGENNVFKIAAAIGFAVLAVAVGSHLFRKTDKQLEENNQQLQMNNQQLQMNNQQLQMNNQQLQGDNKTLKAGIEFVANADANNTDLTAVKTSQVFENAKQVAHPA